MGNLEGGNGHICEDTCMLAILDFQNGTANTNLPISVLLIDT